jgi:hypothetical protein
MKQQHNMTQHNMDTTHMDDITRISDSSVSQIFDIMDNDEVKDALSVYKQFDRDKYKDAIAKATKYVDEVKKLCISADVQSPLVDSMIDMEKLNINLLCKQVFYAMHAIDSIFDKIDAEGGDMGSFAAMIGLQNNAMRLLQSYIAYCRQLPHVIASFNSNMLATQEQNGVVAQQALTDGPVASGSETATNIIVTRTITDLIKAAEKHVDTFEQMKQSNEEDDDDLRPMFEMSPEAKALYDSEKYVDEPTYAELLKQEGKDFDIAKETAVQAKPKD